MGFKENFSQAVKELTGGGKEEPKKYVDNMKKAVEQNDEAELRADGSYGRKPDITSSFSADNDKNVNPLNFNLNKISSENTDDEFGTSFTSGLSPQDYDGLTDAKNAIENSNNTFADGKVVDATNEANTSFSNNVSDNISNGFSDDIAGSNSFTKDTYNESFTAQQPAPSEKVFSKDVSYETNATERERKSRPIEPEDKNELTVISRNTVVTGNIRSFANMSIDGNIRGDVDTTKNIDLNGNVEGNLTCNNASMRIAQVKGNLQMKGSVQMQSETILVGDLNSTYANINGKIQGNIDVAGKAEFKKDSVVFGDISASLITVDEGAVIKGYVDTTFLSKEESKNIFPDTISISDL